jgi:predicted lysophospholipase L1 biosynthesis ABC-type transport system permease subunit
VILGGDTHPITIVGVVGDVLHERLRAEQPTPMLYTPLMQYTGAGVFGAQPPDAFGLIGPAVTPRLTAEIRTASDPAALAASIDGEARSLDKGAIVSYVRTMADQVDASVNQERVLARLSLAFAALATMLTSVGLFGVMSYTVLQRTKEIGIRVALGATRILVISRVLIDAVVVAIGGIVLGLAVAVVATRVLTRFLFGLSPHDPATLGATATVLLITMVAAAWLPARRAATIDPMHALRSE